MQQRREFIRRLSALGAVLPVAHATSPRSTPAPAATPPSAESREEWVRLATRLADPVLGALAAGRLRATMPVELSATATAERRDYAHLEAVGRLLAGIAPWLELGADSTPEGAIRGRLAGLAREGLRRGTDPSSPDFLNFTRGRQPLVDAAFLGHAIVRAPKELLEKLDIHAGCVVPSTIAVMNLRPSPPSGSRPEDALFVKVAPDSIATTIFQNSRARFYRRVAEMPLYDAVYPTMMYYQDKLGGKHLSSATVCGYESDLFAEMEELEERLSVPVRGMEPRTVEDIYKPALGAAGFVWANLI